MVQLILSSFILVDSLIDALGLFFVIFCESLKYLHFCNGLFQNSLSINSNNLLVRQPSHLELFISESYEQLVQFHSLCVDTVDGENPPFVNMVYMGFP